MNTAMHMLIYLVSYQLHIILKEIIYYSLSTDPLNTSLSEWHVFFYLHQDFIATSSHLPVTVQSAAPFGELSYKVSIVKCLDTKTPDCGNYSILNSTLIAFHT